MLGLLPAELLYLIHLYSLSPSLPCIDRHIYTTFQYATPQHCALYLLHRHPTSTLQHAIRYGICSLNVVQSLERLASRSGSDPSSIASGRLKCRDLPKRLFKGLARSAASSSLASLKIRRRKDREDEHDRRSNNGLRPEEDEEIDMEVDIPLITHLLSHYRASPNFKKGYPLARAVYARHLPLVRLLLAFDADPAESDAWCVLAAIGNGDLELVRLLLEREWPVLEDLETNEAEVDEDADDVLGGKSKKRRKSGEFAVTKIRRLEYDDRCAVTRAMLEGAVKAERWEIVAYLRRKGAVPSLEVLRML